jgi:pimeloyl-ACP methyl ester carboxylesterase
VANSYGCQVATEALLLQPVLAGRLVLLGPTMDPRLRRYGAVLRRWAREPQSRALQRLLVREYLSAGLGRAVATLRHALDDAIEDRLPHLALPTLVVRGTRDPIVADDWARRVVDLLPDAQLRRLPGATHAINHDMPRQTAWVLRHFLDHDATDRPDAAAAAA